jgi:hypothetical protein
MAHTTARDILLVGSIGLADAEEVFRAAGSILGDKVRRLTDGETGIARSVWIQCQTPFFLLHPQLEMVVPDPDKPGTYRAPRVPATGIYAYTAATRFVAFARLRPGVSPTALRFDTLGYADWALESYEVFKRLKSAGAVPSGARFQVCIPSPRAVLQARVLPEEIAQVEPSYEAGLFREIERIAAGVPASELSVQWDCTEPPRYELADPQEKRAMIERLMRIGGHVPEGVEIGYHLCYGDFEHRHGREPQDTGTMVELANAICDGVPREIGWLHMPVPRDRSDDAYFAPLRALQLHPETRLYLGLVHYTDGVEGARQRLAAAHKVVSDFGIATECGFGRRPKSQDIREIMRLHVQVAGL